MSLHNRNLAEHSPNVRLDTVHLKDHKDTHEKPTDTLMKNSNYYLHVFSRHKGKVHILQTNMQSSGVIKLMDMLKFSDR